MIPDSTNVYGIVTAPHGLQPVLNAIKTAVVNCRAYIYRSQFNGAETLHLRGDSSDFGSEPLGDGAKHLFNGAVGGSLNEVRDMMRNVSNALSTAGIEHSLEIYDSEQKLVELIQGKQAI